MRISVELILSLLAQGAPEEEILVPPGNRLERLSGDRAAQHSVRINERWRICFEWRSADAYSVEIVDFH